MIRIAVNVRKRWRDEAAGMNLEMLREEVVHMYMLSCTVGELRMRLSCHRNGDM